MRELGHGHAGVTGKREPLANRWAAYRLIRFEDVLAAAAAEQAGVAVAASLGLLPSVLDVYQEALTQAELREVRRAALARAS